MALKPVERINFDGDDAQQFRRLQDSVIRALNPIAALPPLNGVLVGPFTIGTSFAPVNHGLGRQYIGWEVVRKNALVTICEDFTFTSQTASISLKASAAVTVYLWVF